MDRELETFTSWDSTVAPDLDFDWSSYIQPGSYSPTIPTQAIDSDEIVDRNISHKEQVENASKLQSVNTYDYDTDGSLFDPSLIPYSPEYEPLEYMGNEYVSVRSRSLMPFIIADSSSPNSEESGSEKDSVSDLDLNVATLEIPMSDFNDIDRQRCGNRTATPFNYNCPNKDLVDIGNCATTKETGRHGRVPSPTGCSCCSQVADLKAEVAKLNDQCKGLQNTMIQFAECQARIRRYVEESPMSFQIVNQEIRGLRSILEIVRRGSTWLQFVQ